MAWVAFLGGTTALLHGLGGPLPAPPVMAPSEMGGWLTERGPATAVVAVMRLAALAVTWYLVAATAVALVARASGRGLALSAARAVSLPLVRRLVGGALGLTLAAGPGMAAATPVDRSGVGPAPPSAAVVMQRLPDEGSTTTSAPPPSTTTTTPEAVGGDEAPPAAPAVPTWEVAPGQHFWAVAELVLSDAWGRAPTDLEVDGYWRVLVETNRPVLRDPANPDLLYPGQVLTVPPAPPRPG